jgi:excisionase family DNA binding protein
MTMASLGDDRWLSLAEASRLLGVHFTTLRRWADAGSAPHFRTPGGHRRFRKADLEQWMGRTESTGLVPAHDVLVRSAVGFARHEMSQQQISREPWHAAFVEEERRAMGETGRALFGLAIRYVMRTRGRERVLQEGQRIGQYYGQQCAQRGVPLADTARAFIFFRRVLLDAVGQGQGNTGELDAEDVRIQRSLYRYLDEVMCACLESYERHSRLVAVPEGEE